jgi:branched-chain amino acid transport system substrate-binding protein
MKHKSIFTRLIVVSLFISALCLATSGDVVAEAPKEIILGGVVSLTGPIAALAIDQKYAYELAVENINKEGGVYVKEYGKKIPVKLILQDDEGDAGKAADATERLIKIHNVHFILGTQYDHKNIPCAIVAEKYKVLYMMGTCTQANFLSRKFKWSTLYFANGEKFGKVPFEIMNTIPEAQRPKRIGMFLMDDPAGELFRGFFRTQAEKYGYSTDFPVDEPFPFGLKDYSSLLIKAKAKKIDGLFLLGTTEDSITLVRQMKEMDINVSYFHGYAGTWGIDFWDALGKDAQYVLADSVWSEEYPYPYCKEMGELFYKKFGKKTVFMGLFYAYAQILFEAIERAGTLDGAKVRAQIVSSEFKDTVMGDVKYDEHGSAVADLGAHQWIDGDQYLIYPFIDGVSRQVKLAPPWDKR